MGVSLPLDANHSVCLQYIITCHRVYVQVYGSLKIRAICGAPKCVNIFTKIIGHRFMVVVFELWVV